jgi:hypothetical protein
MNREHHPGHLGLYFGDDKITLRHHLEEYLSRGTKMEVHLPNVSYLVEEKNLKSRCRSKENRLTADSLLTARCCKLFYSNIKLCSRDLAVLLDFHVDVPPPPHREIGLARIPRRLSLCFGLRFVVGHFQALLTLF